MSISDFQPYADDVYMEVFDGVKQRVSWTKQLWSDIIQLLWHVRADEETDETMQLEVSRQIRGFVSDIVDVIGGKKTALKYRMYSASDDNVMAWLNNIVPNHRWQHIKLGSSLTFAISRTHDSRRATVQVHYNGLALQLLNCEQPVCSIQEFYKHLSTVLYTGNLEAACARNLNNFLN